MSSGVNFSFLEYKTLQMTSKSIQNDPERLQILINGHLRTKSLQIHLKSS